MHSSCTGVSYAVAGIEQREELYRRRNQIESLCAGAGALLWTCNRCEVYSDAADAAALRALRALRAAFGGLWSGAYHIEGSRDVFHHALRVACGLESQLRGEAQILAQIEELAARARIDGGFWDLVTRAARGIRRESGLDSFSRDIADVILGDIRRAIGSGPVRVAVIGTGNVAELFARKRTPGYTLSFGANKNFARARYLGSLAAGAAFRLQDSYSVLQDADALVCATSSPHYVVGMELVSAVMAGRNKPLYMYDAAFPRDIAPAARGIPGVVLKDQKDLQAVFDAAAAGVQPLLARAAYLARQAADSHEYDLESRCAAEPAGA